MSFSVAEGIAPDKEGIVPDKTMLGTVTFNVRTNTWNLEKEETHRRRKYAHRVSIIKKTRKVRNSHMTSLSNEVFKMGNKLVGARPSISLSLVFEVMWTDGTETGTVHDS